MRLARTRLPGTHPAGKEAGGTRPSSGSRQHRRCHPGPNGSQGFFPRGHTVRKEEMKP